MFSRRRLLCWLKVLTFLLSGKKHRERIVLELQGIITCSRFSVEICLYRHNKTRKYLRHDQWRTEGG